MTNNHNNNNKNIKTYIMYINIIPHISVWGSSFLAATPLAAAIRRRRGYLSHAPSSSHSKRPLNIYIAVTRMSTSIILFTCT